MVNSKEFYFRKTNRATTRSFKMEPSMFELMVAIDGHKTIREIAHEVKMPVATFKSHFLTLVKLGLIEKIDAEHEYVDDAFVKNIKETLTQLNGPMGEILLDDAAEEMGIESGRVPLSNLPNFIEILARHIPSEKQANEFRERMLKEMKTLSM